jgi:hypothetical protein
MGFLPVLTGSDPRCLSGQPGNLQGWVSIEQLTKHTFGLFHSPHLYFDGGFFYFPLSCTIPLKIPAHRPFSILDSQ